MTIKTASFRTYTGPGRVSIARSARGAPAGYRIYKALAPGTWFNSVSRPEYERRFNRQLALLDPRAVVLALHDLVQPHDPVLLCWESPPFTSSNWCHRRIVAAWLERELDIKVCEYGTEGCGHDAR